MAPALRSRAGRLRCSLSGYDARVLDLAGERLAAKARAFGARVQGPVPLPVETSTLLLSEGGVSAPYTLRLQRRQVDLLSPSLELVEALVRLSLPAGVSIALESLA